MAVSGSDTHEMATAVARHCAQQRQLVAQQGHEDVSLSKYNKIQIII